MVRADGAYVKQMRLSKIKNYVRSKFPNGIAMTDLLDWIEIQMGLKRETAMNYAELVVRSNKWTIVDGIIKEEVKS